MDLSVKKSDKHFLTPTRKWVEEYNLIEPNDKIAVGLSGGKDSSTLFYILTVLKKQFPFDFELVPITLDMGFDAEVDLVPLKKFVSELEYDLIVEPTDIAKIIFDIRQEKNPCSLCANLRRGALNNIAKDYGCNKVALGHHLDDGIETFFMNLLYNSKMAIFKPKTYLDRKDITVIRPLLAVEEKSIKNIINAKNIPVIHNPCPADKNTKREEIKELVNELSKKYPKIRTQFLKGAKTIDIGEFWLPPRF
ncbi:ATP-binding protein [Proteinivorax hydrogeniformans]|uniref:ATP-binding protein n=1 Tax=Proteinivorax hydrogeniformans TaxID=1826727 RepID=A0AAU8HV62_9FIRM